MSILQVCGCKRARQGMDTQITLELPTPSPRARGGTTSFARRLTPCNWRRSGNLIPGASSRRRAAAPRWTANTLDAMLYDVRDSLQRIDPLSCARNVNLEQLPQHMASAQCYCICCSSRLRWRNGEKLMVKRIVTAAVCSAPHVKQVWQGFKDYFVSRGFPYDYVLFDDYGPLIAALLDGSVDLSWNSPLSFVATRRFGQHLGMQIRGIAMRDTDLDVQTSFIVRARSRIFSLPQLRDRTIGLSGPFAPEDTLLPLEFLDRHGLRPERDFTRVMFDLRGSLSGPLPLSIHAALDALLAGHIDACCLRADHLERFSKNYPAAAQQCREIARTDLYDLGIFATRSGAEHPLTEAFVQCLLEMSYDDPDVRPLFDLENLRRWVPGRETGFDALTRAIALYGLPRDMAQPRRKIA
jgi:phosphonate transport system substrate-binding protein